MNVNETSFSFEIRHAHRCCKPCSDWSIATVHMLTVLALPIGCRDHRQSATRSRIRDRRHCIIVYRVKIASYAIVNIGLCESVDTRGAYGNLAAVSGWQLLSYWTLGYGKLL